MEPKHYSGTNIPTDTNSPPAQEPDGYPASPAPSQTTQIQPQAPIQPQTAVGFVPDQPNDIAQQPYTTQSQSAWQPQPNGIFVGGMSPATSDPASKKSKKKKLIIFGGLTIAMLAAIGGGVFGLYLPNTPNHVWDTGINRSGKAFDSLVMSATDKSKLASYKTSDLSGTIDATFQDQNFHGDFTTKFDQTNLDGGLNVTIKDKSTSKQLSAKVLSEIPKGSDYPNIYFQINGLKALGVDELVPSISNYDSKWIVVDAAYLKSLGSTYTSGGDNNASQITSADIADLARSSSNITTQYLLSTDKAKGVFVKQSYVGREKVDGPTAYHYKVGINIPHAEAYCVALRDNALSSTAYKKISGSDAAAIDKTKKSSAEDCKNSVSDNIKSTDSYDMWIDGKYKLVYKFRAYDKSDKGKYTDVGQIYKGADALSLFVAVHDTSGKSDAKLTLNTNLKTNITSGLMTYIGTSTDNPYNVKITLGAKSSSDKVNITKPVNPITIQEVMTKLGIPIDISTDSNADTTNTTIGQKAADTERRTDIGALQGQLEAYYAATGVYPSLRDLNSAPWRKTNMAGIDDEALKTPSGTVAVLLLTSDETHYGYTPGDCTNSTDCQSYTLTAKLSDGTTLTKKSLN